VKLSIVRYIGAIGLVLDVWFHWLEERNIWEFLVDDFFEAENEARWETFPLGGDLFIRGLSITAHIMLLTALVALLLAPWLIRELKGRGLSLRFWQWWGGIGLLVDFVFHFLEQGQVGDILLDDFFEGSVFFRGLSLAAHVAFITALVFLIFAPWLIRDLRRRR
jgi:hypothetical protein